jgi:hypothetical protein
MEYIEQTHKTIIFYLINKAVDCSFFNVVSKHSFKHKNLDIEFGILTESHFVSVSSNNDALTEICACKDYEIAYLKKSSIEATARSNYKKTIGEFTYTFSSSIVSYRTGKKLLKDLKSKQRNSNTHYLTHTFPGRWAWSRPACTEVYVTVDNNVVTETVHTYPNEKKMVFTKSVITTI